MDSNDKPPLRATISSSNLHRRRLCPASARMEDGLPESESADATEGTLLHWHDAHPDAPKEALTLPQRGTLVRNDALRSQFYSTQLERLGIPPEVQPRIFRDNIELFFCGADGIPLDPPFPGHPDVIYHYPHHGVVFIFDSKFGRIPVPKAHQNLQLRSYAVMFAENFDVTKVFVAITQPLCAPPDDFHAAEYSAADIAASKAEILGILDECGQPNAAFNPSMEACGYCRAKHLCDAAQEIVQDLALAKVKEMSIPELERRYLQGLVARKVIDQVEDRMKAVAAQFPDALQHFQLGPAHMMRTVRDPQAAFDRMFHAGGILNEIPELAQTEFDSARGLSLPTLETEVAVNRQITEKDAQAKIATALGDLLEIKPKERSLVKRKNT